MARFSEWNIMMSRRALVVAATAAALGLHIEACGSRSDDEPPIPIDDLARLLADAVCDNIGPCCAQGGFPHDPAQCHANAESELRKEIDGYRASANILYDGAAARACVDAFAAAIKACRDDRPFEAACTPVFVGTLKSGQSCTQQLECAQGLDCRMDPGGGASQCVASTTEVRGKLGDACFATCIEDASGTGCFGGGSGGTGGQGGAGSTGNASCYMNDGLYCDGMGRCARAPGLNEPCTTNGLCAGETFCENGICAAKRTSGPCGQIGDACAATAYCDSATQQCSTRRPTGSACTSNECLSTDQCYQGTCRTRTIASERICAGDI